MFVMNYHIVALPVKDAITPFHTRHLDLVYDTFFNSF